MCRMRRFAMLLAAIVVATMLSFNPAVAEDGPAIVNSVPPTVSGVPRYANTLSAVEGTWSADVTFAYQWLRNGTRISGATARTYRLGLADRHKRMSVRVTASRADSAPVAVTSAQSSSVGGATISNRVQPRVAGIRKYRKTLTGSRGSWSVPNVKIAYTWLRNGKAIPRAHSRRYKLGAADVGARLQLRIRATKPGYINAYRVSKRTGVIRHLRPVKRTVKYRVVTRGKIKTSLKTFKAQAKATLNDPRGWRSMGIAFKEVKSGGSMTLVLSQASKVPSYSSGCSKTYSCRVGRYVIINQDRWRKATPSWNKAKGSLRGYRHMVVTHETGHWLGLGHRRCGRKGSLAPVMQQQSKSLKGCKFNSWPKASELHSPRFRMR